MSDYDETCKIILLSESVDFTAQYRYEHRSFEQCTNLEYVY